MGKRIWMILRGFFIAMGILLLLMVGLAFTRAPFHVWYQYSLHFAGVNRSPEFIILLGGGGMPSGSNLMRCWFTEKAAKKFPGSRVILALPGNIHDTSSALNRMKQEMIFRGIDPERILLEDSGANTRAQALRVADIIRNVNTGTSVSAVPILLVSSPEHIYRSFLTFRKAGFEKVNALPAFEQAIESDITFSGNLLGGRRWVPDIGEQVALRYHFWTQLRFETLLLREWLALSYYWMKGWI